MATDFGWYRCPKCDNRTQALDDSGGKPDCPDCRAAAAVAERDPSDPSESDPDPEAEPEAEPAAEPEAEPAAEPEAEPAAVPEAEPASGYIDGPMGTPIDPQEHDWAAQPDPR